MIVITRPKEDAIRTADILKTKGYITLIEPMLEIEYLERKDELLQILEQDPDIILVTSANAIRAFARLTEDRDYKVITVGENSAEEAKRLGFRKVESADGDAKKIIEYVNHNIDKDKETIVYAKGSVTTIDVGGSLRNSGYQVEDIEIYDAKPVSGLSREFISALINCEVNIITFYSSRTANFFMKKILEKNLGYLFNNIKAVCISNAVAEKLSDIEWSEIIACDLPTQQNMLDLIEENMK